MSTKMVFPCTLVLAVLGVCAIRAQDLLSMPSAPGPPPAGQFDPARAPVVAAPETGPPTRGPTPVGLSKWITYERHECCGNVGANGPITGELYVLTGIEIPAEGKIFGHVLETGWVVQSGGRSLFFNTTMDKAWDIDLSVSNVFNRGQHSDIKVTLNLPTGPQNPNVNPPPPIMFANRRVSVRQLNRTYVNAAFGREWYLHRPPDVWIQRWRVGLDAGARLGSEKLELNEVTHRHDVIGGLFITLSSDLEFPCGCCTFLAGMRTEWGYNWSDVLQRRNDSDLQDVNILFTAGVRF